ncbi:MAG: GTP-binding protein [Thermodesulfovibrionales bacterium]
MKITIVSGMLGSGKTTFIQHIAIGTSLETVVLVNDFGKAGIDGELFSASGIESIELPSGCICCTLKSDLITTIRKIISDHAPEHLIIEPSGIASPSGVIEALAELGLEHFTVIGIIDATEFLELYEADMYGKFFQEQVSMADIVLINKIDLIEDALRQKTAALINALNPRAITYETVRAATHEPLPDFGHRDHPPTEGRNLLRFDTISLTLKGEVSFGSIEDFLQELSKGIFGNVIRAKALVQTDKGPGKFDLTFGSISAELFGRQVSDNRLVIIGETLDRKRILNEASVRWGSGLSFL